MFINTEHTYLQWKRGLRKSKKLKRLMMKFVRSSFSTARVAGHTDKFFMMLLFKAIQFSVTSDITVHYGLLLKGNRITIPSAFHLDILDKLHSGHQGISKCKRQSTTSSVVARPQLTIRRDDT